MRRSYYRGKIELQTWAAKRRIFLPAFCAFAFFLILLSSTGQNHAQDSVQIKVTGSAQGGGAVISLVGAAIPKPSIRQESNELLLTFGRAIEVSLAGVSPDLPAVESITYGYDSLLVQTSVPATFQLKVADALITVAVMPKPTDEPGGQADEQRRVDLARVRLLQKQGKLAEARSLAERVVGAHPRDPEAIVTLAAIEAEIGRNRRALALYDRALAQDPSNAVIRADRAGVEYPIGRLLSVEPRFVFEEGGDRQSMIMNRFQAPINDTWRVLLGFDTNFVDVAPVVRPSGEAAAFDGTRYRGEIGALHEWEQGHTARLSLYGNAETIGAGGEFRFVEDDGTTIFAAAYHQPNWEFTELVVNDGWRDRLLIGREQRVFEQIAGRLAISGNRYGMDEVEDAAYSIRVEGELTMPLGGPDSPYRLAYRLDAEYPGNEARLEDDGGNEFTVLDIQSREVHSLTIGYNAALESDTINEDIRPDKVIDVYGGWAIDRRGGNGPVLGAAVSLYGTRSFSLQVLADYVQDTGREGDTVLTIGGYARWRF